MIQDHGDGGLLRDCCRVPTILHHLKEEDNTPKVVSIGPFQFFIMVMRGCKTWKGINKQCSKVLLRAGSSFKNLVPFVQYLEPKVRASYLKTINLTDKQELVDVILLDVSFIIELFIMSYEYQTKEGANNDAILKQQWLDNSVLLDLLLLENQLPFFFIEEHFNKAFPFNRCCCLLSFLGLTYGYFKYHNWQELKPDPDVKIKHFTGFHRLLYLQGTMSERQSIPKDGSHVLSYNVNALEEAGVELRDNHKSKCLLDLKFSGDTLKIPQIVVDDNTELLFHNMMALEQYLYPYVCYITDYPLVLEQDEGNSKT